MTTRFPRTAAPAPERLAAALLVPATAAIGVMVAWLDAAAILSSLLTGHGLPQLRGGWRLGRCIWSSTSATRRPHG